MPKDRDREIERRKRKEDKQAQNAANPNKQFRRGLIEQRRDRQSEARQNLERLTRNG